MYDPERVDHWTARLDLVPDDALTPEQLAQVREVRAAEAEGRRSPIALAWEYIDEVAATGAEREVDHETRRVVEALRAAGATAG